MIGRSGFGDSIDRVKDAFSDNIQGIISLGGSLMWNDAAVYGDRMELILFVRDWSEMLNSLESESAIIFLVPLMC